MFFSNYILPKRMRLCFFFAKINAEIREFFLTPTFIIEPIMIDSILFYPNIVLSISKIYYFITNKMLLPVIKNCFTLGLDEEL